eukprot:CAMPEP_0174849098 /NCGR_PEP_ID=MMETSP1114-20130205/13900_1 /TAXON_ID=312471 /ORGANISM="Neobodo designis, Strain CCAP 1951/1" /LENGTH=107 /DNA_ID=CAMNT_0016083409 /DNA_START=34 /DNA_END=357 /DNA_ORIENTATION=+
MLHTTVIVAGTLAAVNTAGGLAGFLRKKSVGSLLGGLLIGITYAYAAVLLAGRGEEVEHGRVIALGGSGLLSLVMGIRYIKTFKPVPLVLMTVGIAAATYFAVVETA